MSSSRSGKIGITSRARYRSLSLEDSDQEDPLATFDESFNKDNFPQRRRLNTYVNPKESRRNLDESVEEDGRLIRSYTLSNGSGPYSKSVIEKSELSFFNYLLRHPCYELMPQSSKLVVFDTRLPARKAFYSMLHNNVSSAMLWSHEKQNYIAVLTVFDFIRAVCHQYDNGGISLEEMGFDSWLGESQKISVIGAEDNLARATILLLSSRIRRLPVCDPATGNILFAIAHKHIARFVYMNSHRMIKPRSWYKSLETVGIGTYTDIATATPQTKVIDALKLLIKRKISALPVINPADDRLVGIFTRSDALVLMFERAYLNLDRLLAEVIPSLNEDIVKSKHIKVCTLDETLGTTVEKLVRGRVHRLIVVDSAHRVVGILSLTDILRFFIRASSHTETPNGGSMSFLTASIYDISTNPSPDQIETSLSLGSGPSPLTAMAFSQDSCTTTSSLDTKFQPDNSLNLGNSFGNENRKTVTPSIPLPPRQMAGIPM